MKKRLYFAYGSNCNIAQMRVRCPGAQNVGTATLADYRLVFRGPADIEQSEGAEVTGVLWMINSNHEKALDRYEGYPGFYTKIEIEVETEDATIEKAMVYLMIERHQQRYSVPYDDYYYGIEKGYKDNGISTTQLEQALYFTMDKLNLRRQKA